MASFNRVVLLGNLTRDVELKYTQNQVAIGKIGLAVNDRVKKNNEWVDEVTFVDITFFGRTAEVASEYLSKGSQVLIEGRLKYESWESDGQKRSKLAVIGERMQMLGSRTGGGKPHSGAHADANEYESASSAVSDSDHSDHNDRSEVPDVPF